jgi:hypothetical protein
MNATGTHLEDEIREQPDAITRVVVKHEEQVARIGAAVRGGEIDAPAGLTKVTETY